MPSFPHLVLREYLPSYRFLPFRFLSTSAALLVKEALSSTYNSPTRQDASQSTSHLAQPAHALPSPTALSATFT